MAISNPYAKRFMRGGDKYLKKSTRLPEKVTGDVYEDLKELWRNDTWEILGRANVLSEYKCDDYIIIRQPELTVYKVCRKSLWDKFPDERKGWDE
jgi:hypothetical protein